MSSILPNENKPNHDDAGDDITTSGKKGSAEIVVKTVAETIAADIKRICRCFEHSEIADLEQAVEYLWEYFMKITAPEREDKFKDAMEQRMLGMLCAEVQEAIDKRKDGLVAADSQSTEGESP